MNVLVLGATGLLGQAVMASLNAKGFRPLGVARSGADLTLDITNQLALLRLLTRVEADAVINCAACVDLAACEDDPDMAYRVNGQPASALAAWSDQTGNRYIQISTDHYFDGDVPVRNDEQAIVGLVNAYAASKFAGEAMAREVENALIVRTNICGARKGFGRWVLDSLREAAPMSLYTDYFTSTMHVEDCADVVADLLRTKANGVLNVASRDVASKADFVRAVARAMKVEPGPVVHTSVSQLSPRRARSCGLDVSRAEALLARDMPTLEETAQRLVAEDTRCATLTNSKSATALSA